LVQVPCARRITGSCTGPEPLLYCAPRSCVHPVAVRAGELQDVRRRRDVLRITLMRISVLLAFWGLLLLTSCSQPGRAQDLVLDLLLTDDTLYAPGYTDDHFNRIEVGMTEAEVLRRLGPPIDHPYHPTVAGESWDTGMRWTRSAHDSNYKCRVVIFRAGRVSEKHAEFYVD